MDCPADTSITELDEKDLDGAVGVGLPGYTRLNKGCFPVYIQRVFEPVRAFSNAPTLGLDSLGPSPEPW